jgi:hypothetical protein
MAWLARGLYAAVGVAVLGAIVRTAFVQVRALPADFPWVLAAILPWALLWLPWGLSELMDSRRGFTIEALYCRGTLVVAIGDGRMVSPMQYEAHLVEEPCGVRFQGQVYRFEWLAADQRLALQSYLASHGTEVPPPAPARDGPRSGK